MKKLYFLLVSVMVTSMLWAQDYYVLDVKNAEVPEGFTFTGDSECWDSTYSENFPFLELPPFSLSHLCGGASYGGVYWDGFTVCRSSDNVEYPESQMLAHQWDVMPGGGIKAIAADGQVDVDGNEPYFLGYWSAWYGASCNQVLFNDGNQYRPIGVYVTNTCYAYYSIKNGTSSAHAFNKEGDSFKLIAYGVSKDRDEATSCEIELAGFHDGEFEALTDWTWWDLSSLGDCEQIYFEMTSTDVGTWGINTPTYFGMSDLTVQLSQSTALSEVSEAKQVARVTYYNLSGHQSAQPFEGVNIEVTTYSDGTTSSVKVLR